MKSSYPVQPSDAKHTPENFLEEFEKQARSKVGEILQAYLEQEVDELLQRVRYGRREPSMPVAYRDGHDGPRSLTTGSGTITVKRPRVRGATQNSNVLPRYQRRAASLDKAMHNLWIEGLGTRDVEPALRALLGEKATLSASTVTRTNAKFIGEYDDWSKRSLAEIDVVYL